MLVSLGLPEQPYASYVLTVTTEMEEGDPQRVSTVEAGGTVRPVPQWFSLVRMYDKQ